MITKCWFGKRKMTSLFFSIHCEVYHMSFLLDYQIICIILETSTSLSDLRFMLDLLYTFNSSSVYLHCISHHTTDQHICYTDLFKIRKRKKKQLYIWNILYLVQHTVSLHFSSLFLKLLWRFICQSFLLKCILFTLGPFWNLTTAMFHTGWSHGRFILKYHTSFVYLCCSIHVSWYMVFNATFNNIS
jgi:hypothetical protein